MSYGLHSGGVVITNRVHEATDDLLSDNPKRHSTIVSYDIKHVEEEL